MVSERTQRRFLSVLMKKLQMLQVVFSLERRMNFGAQVLICGGLQIKIKMDFMNPKSPSAMVMRSISVSEHMVCQELFKGLMVKYTGKLEI